MNSQELKCFVVAADRLNFTRAAKELYVTPPTVTHHIQHLEEELGVKLFIRNSKSVQLTTAGEIFYHDAHDILLRMEAIPNRLNAVKSNEQTLLKIGCTMSQETKYLTQALRLFHRENSRVSPRIYLDDYFQLVNRLVENQLDFILGTKIMMQDRPECTFRKLSTKVREKNVIRQDDIEAVLALTLSGYGIGILPDYAFSIQDLDESVKVVSLQESLEIDYGIIYLKKDRNKLLKEFIECFNK